MKCIDAYLLSDFESSCLSQSGNSGSNSYGGSGTESFLIESYIRKSFGMVQMITRKKRQETVIKQRYRLRSNLTFSKRHTDVSELKMTHMPLNIP